MGIYFVALSNSLTLAAVHASSMPPVNAALSAVALIGGVCIIFGAVFWSMYQDWAETPETGDLV